MRERVGAERGGGAPGGRRAREGARGNRDREPAGAGRGASARTRGRTGGTSSTISSGLSGAAQLPTGGGCGELEVGGADQTGACLCPDWLQEADARPRGLAWGVGAGWGGCWVPELRARRAQKHAEVPAALPAATAAPAAAAAAAAAAASVADGTAGSPLRGGASKRRRRAPALTLRRSCGPKPPPRSPPPSSSRSEPQARPPLGSDPRVLDAWGCPGAPPYRRDALTDPEGARARPRRGPRPRDPAPDLPGCRRCPRSPGH